MAISRPSSVESKELGGKIRCGNSFVWEHPFAKPSDVGLLPWMVISICLHNKNFCKVFLVYAVGICMYLYNPFYPIPLKKISFFFKIEASNSTLRMNDILKDPSVFQRCVLGPRNVIQLLWSFLGSLFILWDLVTIPLELYDACRPNHDEIWEVFAPKKPVEKVFPWLTCGSPEQKHHTICEA